MKKQDKVNLVKDLTGTLKEAPAVILVNYAGLSVKMQQDLKKRLKVSGSSLTVVKNTLFQIAGKNADLPQEALEDTVLEGPTALILSGEDPIAPLQVLAKFAKEFEIPQFKVGVVEGSFQDKASLDKLSKLPGKDVLFAQVVGTIGAPMYGLVGTLQGNLQKLIWILKTKAGQS